MNSRFLETFVELARTPQLRRVAERLHATPGALSMRIRSLEQELGVELFTLDHKTLALTEAGRRLQPYAQAVLAAVKDLRHAAQQSGTVAGAVRVGMMETVVHTLLPDLVKAMHASLPDVELNLSVGLTAQLTDDLMKGNLDLILCVGQEPGSPYVLTENLFSLPIHWVARRGLVTPNQAMQQVLRHPLLTPMSNTAPYNAAASLVQQLAAAHAIPATAIRISSSPSLAALAALAREGLGIAIIPGLFVKEPIERGELEQLALPAPQPLTIAQWHLLNASPATLRTAETVQRVCAAYCARHADGDWIRAADSRMRAGRIRS